MLLSLLLTSSLVWSAPADAKPMGAGHPIPDDSNTLIALSQNKGPAAVPNEFEMLVWNVHKGEDGEAWAKDLTTLSHGAEFVLLQEGMNDSFMPNALRTLPDFSFWMATSFMYKSDGTSTGVISGFHASADAVSFIRSSAREPFLDTPKMALLSQHHLQNGTPLLVINIHAINFVTNWEFRSQINEILPAITNFKGDVIFAGDFNTWNQGRQDFLDEVLPPLGLTEIHPSGDADTGFDHVYQRGCPNSKLTVGEQYETSDHKPLQAHMICN